MASTETCALVTARSAEVLRLTKVPVCKASTWSLPNTETKVVDRLADCAIVKDAICRVVRALTCKVEKAATLVVVNMGILMATNCAVVNAAMLPVLNP